MKLEHTPGPWKLGTPPPHGEQTIGTKDGLMVAIATMGGINTKANARLIAAAPEMLEALIEVAECRLFWEDSMDRKDGLEYEVKKLIEKATGKPIDEVIQ